jgi:hypothetical protein
MGVTLLAASLVVFAPGRAGADERSCPELRASYRDDPRPQTLFDLAKCEEKAGRIATAAATYDEYIKVYDRLSEPEKLEEREREQLAVSRKEALAGELPHITLTLPKDAPEGTRITRKNPYGGEPIDMMLNVPLLIDPGEHFVTVDVPGRPRWARRFFVQKGDKKTIELEVPAGEKGTETPSRVGKPVEPVPVYLPQMEPQMSSLRKAAWVTAGIGAVGVVVGAVAGGLFLGASGRVEKNCMNNVCNRAGEEATDQARTTGPVSLAGLIAGGVVLAAGAVMFVVDPSPMQFSGIPRRVKIGSAGLTGAVMEMQWTW